MEDFVIKHKTALRKGVDGELWMIKDRIKTEVATRVPVFEEVDVIVKKYGGWEKLPMISLVKFNHWLKIMAASLNLPEDLSSKAGRKTFTNWCFNVLFLSTDAVKVVLGRKSDKGLEVYGRPDERRVAGELEQSPEMKKRKKKENRKQQKQYLTRSSDQVLFVISTGLPPARAFDRVDPLLHTPAAGQSQAADYQSSKYNSLFEHRRSAGS